MKELKDCTTELGIGKCGSGGSKGMSALEGIIAALDVSSLFLIALLH